MKEYEVDAHIEKLLAPVTKAMVRRVRDIIKTCADNVPAPTPLQDQLSVWAADNLPGKANYLEVIEGELMVLKRHPADLDALSSITLTLMLHAAKHNIDLLDIAEQNFIAMKARHQD